ncbi:tRNA (guanosine(46)-N7)-methyltransferase TrmB [Fervidobacterium thailandense]|uniref:tRNA (guanine-N(7)-)-methyltransferase n=1 Tax=Fervidobacterium thailandense TaxID=1008305 RepID=A0A1E3G4E7_9BACT|nr:tRNA (guanosine(46)-N7)-methyltransferase TrmB [Fervidobacterium thailandense]ODN31127.1 tRNA (guanine-N7)-methyltransferase [Fervidobacterium thailandense]
MIKLYVKEIKPAEFDFLPLDWTGVFGNTNPLIVEIGFGSGEYLLELAKRYPEKNFVGFEVSITSMKKANNRLKDLNNVRLVITDARFGMREFFGPRTVEKVIMNFPVPWDKKSHERRRVIVPEFFDTLANVLVDGGTFELATDVRWYAERTIETGVEKGYFELVEFVENPDREVKTRYERKWLSYGRDIYSVTLRKVKHVEVERLIGGHHEMPHIKCQVDESKFSELPGKVFKEGAKVVVIKGVYKSVDGGAYILKVISADGDFQQHYYLVAYPDEGEWIIKLDSASNPYRTPAVKWSVKAIAKFVGE